MFGMGTGIASPPWPPAYYAWIMPPDRASRGERPAAPSGRKGRGNSGRPEKKEDNMAKPLALLVPLGCARRRACTCGLSTR